MSKNVKAIKSIKKIMIAIIVIVVAILSIIAIFQGNRKTYIFDSCKIKINDIYIKDEKVTLNIDFTNRKKESIKYIYTANINAFQKGIGLDEKSDWKTFEEKLRDIQKGTTINLELTYELNDTKSNIEFEITDTWGFKNETKTVKYKIRQIRNEK